MNMSIKVYVLRSGKDGSLYIGLTNNPKRRLAEHNRGNNKSTKGRTPYELLFSEDYNTYPEARKREKYLKSGIGRELIKKQAGIV